MASRIPRIHFYEIDDQSCPPHPLPSSRMPSDLSSALQSKTTPSSIFAPAPADRLHTLNVKSTEPSNSNPSSNTTIKTQTRQREPEEKTPASPTTTTRMAT
ncbi:MAG: hypothetical protein Q9224_003801 [Gallowayella concinna]